MSIVIAGDTSVLRSRHTPPQGEAPAVRTAALQLPAGQLVAPDQLAPIQTCRAGRLAGAMEPLPACDAAAQLSPAETAGYALIVIGLLCLSGLAAGLTLGLLSLDRLNLEVLKRTGTRAEKKWADKVRSACSDMSL
jgi:hypothetical protein